MNKKDIIARIAVGIDENGKWILEDVYSTEQLHKIMDAKMKKEKKG